MDPLMQIKRLKEERFLHNTKKDHICQIFFIVVTCMSQKIKYRGYYNSFRFPGTYYTKPTKRRKDPSTTQYKLEEPIRLKT